MIVKFKDVGRGHASFEVDLDKLTLKTLRGAVKRHLMSREPEFTIDFEKRTGAIVAGFHAVGTFAWGNPDHPEGCICRECRFTLAPKKGKP